AAAEVRRLKGALMGPFGALGDGFYWGALKPALVLVALHAAYLGHLWAPWLFLGLYGAANLGGRAAGFWLGYRLGPDLVRRVGPLGLPTWARRLKAGCALLLGTLVALSAGPTALDRWGVPALLWAPAAGALALGGAWLATRGLRPAWLVYLATLVSVGVMVCT
ncbi:MAG: PTS system mannose/fructose/sorbose family transporter subunit IID, partial [Deferrisomatales bacterium]